MSAEASVEPPRGSRFSAFLYDPMLALGERAGMAQRRRAVLSNARGRVLEIGAGTGLNLEHYPPSLERLVLTEPEEHMAERLAKRVAARDSAAEIVRAPAEALPFEDDSFDAVVSTLVLCTVPDPEAALAEARRLLQPEGRLLFIEHVRADSERLARWQDRLHGPWKAFGDGCNCNRPTLGTIADAGFDVSGAERSRWRRMPPLVHPLVSGTAPA